MSTEALHLMSTAICIAHFLVSFISAACRYRSIWRHSRLFVWQDEAGQPWRDVLRTSARKEFEAARDEKASPTDLLSALLSWGKGRHSAGSSSLAHPAAISHGRVLSSALPRGEIKEGSPDLILVFEAGTGLWYVCGVLTENQAP